MLFADCPLCDAPAPVDLSSGVLDCPACAVRLELPGDAAAPELAAAA